MYLAHGGVGVLTCMHAKTDETRNYSQIHGVTSSVATLGKVGTSWDSRRSKVFLGERERAEGVVEMEDGLGNKPAQKSI